MSGMVWVFCHMCVVCWNNKGVWCAACLWPARQPAAQGAPPMTRTLSLPLTATAYYCEQFRFYPGLIRVVSDRPVSAPALFALLPVLDVRSPCLWFRPPVVVRVRVLRCYDLSSHVTAWSAPARRGLCCSSRGTACWLSRRPSCRSSQQPLARGRPVQPSLDCLSTW